ncbi:MAG TPA: MerR family transcriptional regulator [bacterium]|nr:MerR family transcriptional regulator [bacterium]
MKAVSHPREHSLTESAAGSAEQEVPHGEGSAVPIGSLARAAGVSTRTVRYYEEIGLLRTARRYAGGRRVFGPDALERLRFIGRLKRLGFTLEEIAELNEVFELQRSTQAMLGVLDGKLGQHLEVLDEQMRELARLREDLLSYRQHIRNRLAGLAAKAGRATGE